MSKHYGDSEWALLLAPEPPYPMTGGGAIRTASLCRFLASRYRLHLVAFTTGEGPRQETAERVDWIRLPPHGRSWPERMARNASRLLRGVLPLSDRFSSSSSLRQVARAIEGRRYELAVMEHFWCAGYADLLRQRADRLILDMHNIESALHAGSAASEGWSAALAHRAFAAIARRQERRWLPQFDLVLAASDADAARLRLLAPGARLGVYPNAIPLRFPPPVWEQHCVAFSGNLEYHPNTAAVRFFAGQVWPELKRRDPELRWRLIGRNEWAVRRWIAGDPRIEATGAVEDAVVELAGARVVVAPLLAGSGTRIKILEAWAAGRAVVSTRLGAEGLPAVNGENLLLADSPGEILAAILRLLQDETLRRRLGEAGRRMVEEQFCWPAAWQGLERTLSALDPSFAALPAVE